MKTRIIQTRYWDDEINENVDLYAQHLYIYLLTCKHINICGYFQMRDSLIILEAKLTDNQYESAKKQLELYKKVFFKDGWVWVVNARKNNNYEKSDDNKTACNNELSKIPKLIIQYFNSSVDSTVDSMDTVTKNKKQEIRNKRQEDKEKNIILSSVDLEELQKLFPTKQVKKEFEKAKDWILANGKTYKNYLAFFRNWLRRSKDTRSPGPPRKIKLNQEQIDLIEQGKDTYGLS